MRWTGRALSSTRAITTPSLARRAGGDAALLLRGCGAMRRLRGGVRCGAVRCGVVGKQFAGCCRQVGGRQRLTRGVRDDGSRPAEGAAWAGWGARSHERRRAGQDGELRMRYTDGVMEEVQEVSASARSAESAVVAAVHGSSWRPRACVRRAAFSRNSARSGPLALGTCKGGAGASRTPAGRRAGPDPHLPKALAASMRSDPPAILRHIRPSVPQTTCPGGWPSE